MVSILNRYFLCHCIIHHVKRGQLRSLLVAPFQQSTFFNCQTIYLIAQNLILFSQLQLKFNSIETSESK